MAVLNWLHNLLQDIRYAGRSLAKAPGFLAVVLFSLALGIGANTTIFSVLNAALYRPLPYRHPDRLMVIREWEHGSEQTPPIADTEDWRKQNDVFEDIALTSGPELGAAFSSGAEPEFINVEDVTPNLFALLNVKPVLGRIFLPPESQDRTQTVLISTGFWKRHFDGDPSVLGKTCKVSGMISTVVGVVPDLEPYFPHIDLWQPVNAKSTRYAARADHWLTAIGRLKPGITRVQAQSNMDLIARRLEDEYPTTNKGVGVRVVSLHEVLVGRARSSLYPLMGAVAFILLIACVNVANLLQSRTETRRKEYALRASLGASRRRLMQQLFVESALLGVAGGALGVSLSFWGIDLFRKLAGDFPDAQSISVDGRVLLFTLSISMFTAVLFGLAPAIQASNPDLNLDLKAGGRTTQTGPSGLTRRVLAVSEISLAMVLLIGAGLMINTVLRLQRVDPGFDPNNIITTSIGLPEGGKYVQRVPGGDREKPTPRATTFYEQLLQKVAILPGVNSVGIMSGLPTHGIPEVTFSTEGHAPPSSDKRPQATFEEVSPSVFETLKIPLKRGRYLDEHDTASSPWVVVVNETFARRYFRNENTIGQQVLLRFEPYGTDETRPRQIVGIVGDVKHFGLGNPSPPMVYISYLQHASIYPGGWVTSHIDQDLAIRTAAGLRGRAALMSSVRNIVAELDPEQPTTAFTTMNDLLAGSIDYPRFYMDLLGMFAAIAVLMAVMGVYGVVSYLVSKRTHEIGVRVALGAQPGDVLGLFASMGLKLAAVGVIVGIALSVALTRVIASFLFGVKATDPPTYAAVGTILIVVALLASYIPARRATKVDPMVALRYE